MAVRRLRLDRLRLSRRAHALRLAFRQFAIWHCRYVRLSQGQLLLLQSVVGLGAGVASVSPLELGAARRRIDFSMGPLEPRFGGAHIERQEIRLAKSAAADSS